MGSGGSIECIASLHKYVLGLFCLAETDSICRISTCSQSVTAVPDTPAVKAVADTPAVKAVADMPAGNACGHASATGMSDFPVADMPAGKIVHNTTRSHPQSVNDIFTNSVELFSLLFSREIFVQSCTHKYRYRYNRPLCHCRA